jgi:hypothetical protein
VPGESSTHLAQALLAIPGAMIGLAASYVYGSRVDTRLGVDHGTTRAGAN